MTVGGGVVHSEMPEDEFFRSGGRMHGFQLWVNLPKRDKMIRPRCQEIPREKIPTTVSADGKSRVRVIWGNHGRRERFDAHRRDAQTITTAEKWEKSQHPEYEPGDLKEGL
jgi:redox-sensitive bicupin YhaK (pirin superfamily)